METECQLTPVSTRDRPVGGNENILRPSIRGNSAVTQSRVQLGDHSLSSLVPHVSFFLGQSCVLSPNLVIC